MGLGRPSKWAIERFIRQQVEFKVGNIRGQRITQDNDEITKGQLPPELTMELWNKHHKSEITDVIYSFKTPIAWRTRSGEWFVPEVKYSNTTTNHQNVVRTITGEFTRSTLMR